MKLSIGIYIHKLFATELELNVRETFIMKYFLKWGKRFIVFWFIKFENRIIITCNNIYKAKKI